MPENDLRPWTVVRSRYLVDDRYLRLRVDTARLPDGREIEPYYVRETRGFAVVAAITPQREIVLVRQYKHGIGEIVTELPAGVIDGDESPAGCAARELAEETGYVGDEPRLVRTLYADPSGSNGRFHIFLVESAQPKLAQSLDPTEEIAVATVSLREFAAMIRDGRINSGPQVASGFLVLEALSGPPASSG